MSEQKSRFLVFGLFLIANLLLSYAPLGLEARLCLGLFGLALPAAAAWRLGLFWESKAKPMEGKEFLPPIPPWGWGLVGLLAVAARFTQLTTLFVWPNFDESSYGFDAYQLADHVGPRFFYGVSQAPPFYIWGLALFFKAFGVSLVTLRFFPALISLAVVPLAYGAARTFFSRSFSFFCAVLAAGSFWPVFVGRFSLMTILVLPMECLAFMLMGKFLKASETRAQRKAAWGLGLVWGLGFYTHLHWPVVVVLTAIPLAVWFVENLKKRRLLAFSLAARALGMAFFISLPLVLGAVQRHYGEYLAHLWVFHTQISWTRQVDVWLSCLTSPFWGMDPNVHTYQPQWGGFLNPFLASLFFLGVLEAVRSRQRPLYRFLGAGYLLCLLPGLLTQDMETFRLFPLVPILVAGASLGLTALLRASKPGRNLILVLALFLPSMALDAVHLFGFYHRIWDEPASWGYYTKSVGRYRAFGILEERRKKEGPGLVFPDFVSGLPDQSLAVATYGFNAAMNPRVPFSHAKWSAVLTNVNYRPFLQSRFPDGIAYALSRDFAEPDGGWMLFVFPLNEKRLGVMEDWCKAQVGLESFIDRNLCYIMGESFEKDLQALAPLKPLFQPDAFLRSAYLEKKADLETKQALMELKTPGGSHSAADSAAESLQKAVAEGCPAAHLYEHLGILWLIRQNPFEAKKAFEKAVHAPVNLTDSAQYLSNLDRSNPHGKGP